jgi:hypothetical protein
MERLLKEKEQSNPMEVIPLSAVPLTGVSTTSATKIPSATPMTTLDKTVELEKSMEEMNFQETEIIMSLRTFRNSSILTNPTNLMRNKHHTSSNRNCNIFKRK